MKRVLKLIIVFGVILFSRPFANAYRPFITEDAGVAGKGIAQLEISWDSLEWENSDRENDFLFIPIVGVTERVELSIEIPYLIHNPEEGNNEDGLGDIRIVSKFLLIAETEKNPAFTLKGVVKTESGNEDKRLGSGNVDYSIIGVASKTIGDFQLHSMFGYTFIGDDKDSNFRNIYLYGIGIDYSLLKNIHLVGEITGNRHHDRTANHDPVSGLTGGIYKVSDNIAFDGGIRFGFNDSVPDWNTIIGVTITF